MDFVSDQPSDQTRFRALTVVDVYTREALTIDVGARLCSEHVVATLNRLLAQRGRPMRVFADNGSEFSGRLMKM
ncbi:DDE-type integrase/transposase/recombinase [Caballeronia sp.]|uniref:DDE-type integrase/transposase/recombinase n=1 Tax=Caballeronia sp. TaxID=1931223 RepID=UPI003C4A259A